MSGDLVYRLSTTPAERDQDRHLARTQRRVEAAQVDALAIGAVAAAHQHAAVQVHVVRAALELVCPDAAGVLNALTLVADGQLIGHLHNFRP